MQKPPARQETPASETEPAVDEAQLGVALVGSSLAHARPWVSTATQRPDDAQETAVRCSLSMGVRLHVGADEPGSALASALPP
jgi:hypothetical protein